MSDIVHIPNSFECPHIQFHPDRNSFDPKRGLRSLWANLQDLGRQFCLHDCADCGDRLSEHEKATLLFWNGDLTEYRNAFARAHEAAGQLPENIYNHLLALTNNDCPVCAVHSALKQFPCIANHSKEPLISQDSKPCFHGYRTDETGWNYYDNYIGVEALQCLSLQELPPSLLPAEEHTIRVQLLPGKSVVDYIHDIDSEKVKLIETIADSDLWGVLEWNPPQDKPSMKISERWKAWAKGKIGHFGFNPEEDLLHVIDVAVSWYSNLRSRLNFHRDGFCADDGIRHNELKKLYLSSHYLSTWGDITSQTEFSSALSNGERRSFLTSREWRNNFHLNGTYYSLSFIGKKEAEKLMGKAPCFFQNEEGACTYDNIPFESTPKVTKNQNNINIAIDATTNSAAKSESNSTGIGTGGNVTIVTDKDAYHPETTIAPMIKADPKIESGAVKVEANPTINVEAFDLAAMRAQDVELERIRQENETKRIGMILGKMTPPLHVSEEPKAEDDTRRNQQMTDTALWVEWQRKRGEGVTKAEFSLEKGITVTELQAALNRYRDVRDGVVWPEPDDASDNNSNTPPIAEKDKGNADKDGDDYNGPEPAANSPKQQFVSATMMTKKEMQDISRRSRKWVDGAVEDSNIAPCFIPKISSKPEGFWRHEAMSAIEAKENKRP